MNIPAVAILLLLSLLLIRGTQESAIVNSIIVVTKVSIVLMVIVIGWGFINPANHTPYIPAATTYTTPQGITHRLRRHHGHPRRGRRRLLRLHRLRRGVDRGAGSQEPEARHADRHPRLAGRLHHPLRAVLARAERRGDGRGLPHRRQGSVGRLRHLEVHDRLRVAVEVRDGRDSRRLLVGHPGDAARAVARVLLDEPRRPGAEDLLRGAPEVQDAVEVEHAVLRVHLGCSPASCRRASSAR